MPRIADVEGRVGRDEVSPQVRVPVAGESVAGFTAQVEVNAANGEVHCRQTPGGGRFLPVDRHVPLFAPVRASMNFSDCTNMPPDPQGSYT